MDDFLDFLVGCLWYLALILLPGGGFALLLHFLISLPMRRRDRVMFFLDLIETALDRGEAIDWAIVSVAKMNDRAPGVGFYLLAAQIENGARFGEALGMAPGFLPPQINAMLRAAEKLGDLKKILPACREVVRLPPDAARTTMHYMVTILLMFAPIATFMLWLVATFIVPGFQELATDDGVQIAPMTQFVFNHISWLFSIEAVIFAALLTVTLIYIGGPGLTRFLKFRGFPVVDWISWHLPWKQKQLQRTFSAMLAVLLDGGVPEAEAVRLAGDCTANEICRRRTARIIKMLQQGAKLEDAVRAFDPSGEFHWRLTNAAHARGGFVSALRGWHEALEAKAFQLEETAANAMTSGIVILNGVLVALFAMAIFGLLIAMIKGQIPS